MPPLMALAQGAGVGAALAVQRGVYPGEVDVQEVRAILRGDGVILDRARAPKRCLPKRRDEWKTPAGMRAVQAPGVRQLVHFTGGRRGDVQGHSGG
jgi:hypothetical protein